MEKTVAPGRRCQKLHSVRQAIVSTNQDEQMQHKKKISQASSDLLVRLRGDTQPNHLSFASFLSGFPACHGPSPRILISMIPSNLSTMTPLKYISPPRPALFVIDALAFGAPAPCSILSIVRRREGKGNAKHPATLILYRSRHAK